MSGGNSQTPLLGRAWERRKRGRGEEGRGGWEGMGNREARRRRGRKKRREEERFKLERIYSTP